METSGHFGAMCAHAGALLSLDDFNRARDTISKLAMSKPGHPQVIELVERWERLNNQQVIL
jgi:dihydroxyacid dehydratase/phosphogluconate dehydratase